MAMAMARPAAATGGNMDVQYVQHGCASSHAKPTLQPYRRMCSAVSGNPTHALGLAASMLLCYIEQLGNI